MLRGYAAGVHCSTGLHYDSIEYTSVHVILKLFSHALISMACGIMFKQSCSIANTITQGDPPSLRPHLVLRKLQS